MFPVSSYGVPPGHFSHPSILYYCIITFILASCWNSLFSSLRIIPILVIIFLGIEQSLGFEAAISSFYVLLSYATVGFLLSSLLSKEKLTFEISLLLGFCTWSFVGIIFSHFNAFTNTTLINITLLLLLC